MPMASCTRWTMAVSSYSWTMREGIPLRVERTRFVVKEILINDMKKEIIR